jgi:hypothetical protein
MSRQLKSLALLSMRHDGLSKEKAWDSKLTAHGSLLMARSYFSFGGNVNPNTDFIPLPATLIFVSPGVGRYSALQFSHR